MKKALVFHNPNAGVRNKYKNKTQVRDSLRKIGIEPDFVSVQDYFYGRVDPEDADYELVISAGGDGTNRLAATWILEKNEGLPLGMIPMGSANLLAEANGVPQKYEKAVEAIRRGHCDRIDVGLLNNEHYFLVAFSLGHMAATIAKTPIKEKRKWGFLAYCKNFLLKKIHIWNFRFEIDGKKFFMSGNNLFVFNAVSIFGLMPIKKMDFQDGVFELIVTANRTFIGWITAVYNYFVYNQPRLPIFSSEGTNFIIEPLEAKHLIAQIDGDRIDISRAEITALRGKLKIITPEK